MPERWAITGASGYVGRALRASLEAGGVPSRGLARSNADINADVRDLAAMHALVRDADVFVHMATRRARA